MGPLSLPVRQRGGVQLVLSAVPCVPAHRLVSGGDRASPHHERYSRNSGARTAGATKLLLGFKQPSIFPVASHLAAAAASSLGLSSSRPPLPARDRLPGTARTRSPIGGRGRRCSTFRPRMLAPANNSCPYDHARERVLMVSPAVCGAISYSTISRTSITYRSPDTVSSAPR